MKSFLSYIAAGASLFAAPSDAQDSYGLYDEYEEIYEHCTGLIFDSSRNRVFIDLSSRQYQLNSEQLLSVTYRGEPAILATMLVTYRSIDTDGIDLASLSVDFWKPGTRKPFEFRKENWRLRNASPSGPIPEEELLMGTKFLNLIAPPGLFAELEGKGDVARELHTKLFEGDCAELALEVTEGDKSNFSSTFGVIFPNRQTYHSWALKEARRLARIYETSGRCPFGRDRRLR